MAYKRKLENWIQGFRDWTIERSQVSTLLIDWAAVFTLACVLKRRVGITRYSGYLGGWDCYPYLYVIVVGPSGTGKTTTIRYAYDLLAQIPTLTKPPVFVTVEGLVDDLIKSNDSSVYVTVEELEDITMKDPHGKMFGFLTSMYDGKAELRQKTLARDLEFADKPCINMFAGTTPEWISENIPLTVLNGGFGSRVIWLYVPELRRRRLFYKEEMANSNFPALEKLLVEDLNHIATQIEGEFTISEEARIFMEDWNEKVPTRIKFKKIKGYIQRKTVFVLKLAIIMHVAYSDEMEINLLDFKNAITLIEGLEGNLPRIFEGVGKNEYALDMKDIAMFVKENPGIVESDLRQTFEAAAAPAKLSELIDGLLVGSVLKTEMNDAGKRIFTYVLDE